MICSKLCILLFFDRRIRNRRFTGVLAVKGGDPMKIEPKKQSRIPKYAAALSVLVSASVLTACHEQPELMGEAPVSIENEAPAGNAAAEAEEIKPAETESEPPQTDLPEIQPTGQTEYTTAAESAALLTEAQTDETLTVSLKQDKSTERFSKLFHDFEPDTQIMGLVPTPVASDFRNITIPFETTETTVTEEAES